MAQKTRKAVLGVLKFGPASGYDIKRFFEMNIKAFWNESFGQIYPILRDLKSDGCIQSLNAKHTGEKKNNRNKIIYRINEKGLTELDQWLCSPEYLIIHERNELLLKLFFAGNRTLPYVLDQIKDYKKTMEQALEQYQETERRIIQTVEEKEGFDQWLAILEFGIKASEMQKNWCLHTLSRFDNKE